MSFTCLECNRAGLQCQSITTYPPCSNCLERGFANICSAQARVLSPQPSKEASLHPITSCIIYIKTFASGFFTGLLSPFVYIYNHPKTIVCLRYLYLPFFLFVPIYYSSQASVVLECADKCKEEYDEWIAVLGTRVVNLDLALSGTSSTLANSTDHIELQLLPKVASSASSTERERATPEPIRVPPPYSTSQSPSLPLAKPPPPDKVVKLREAWYRYLDSRVMEWKIAGTTACVFVAASPTIFQIPDASDDPITRSIAFFALCRSLSGIVYGPIFPIYFRTLRAKSAHFAMLWAQDIKRSRSSFFQGQWIMLSLPAVATSWALIAFLLAIFAFIWRTGSVEDPSDWPTATPGRPPMSIDLAMVLRIVITSITLIDVGCLVWIWRMLRSYSQRVWRDEDGGDAFPPTPRSHGRFGNFTP